MDLDDEYYMALAIKEAIKAADMDEVPVGAVIVDQHQQIIGSGRNCPISDKDPTSHAEINAIRTASREIKNYRLNDATLFVTIEPCIMCMGAILHARIKRIVYGAEDPKWGAVNSIYKMTDHRKLNHHPEIASGIYKTKIRQLMKAFFKNKRSKYSGKYSHRRHSMGR